jgi:ArsR family transcriptional regulator
MLGICRWQVVDESRAILCILFECRYDTGRRWASCGRCLCSSLPVPHAFGECSSSSNELARGRQNVMERLPRLGKRNTSWQSDYHEAPHYALMHIDGLVYDRSMAVRELMVLPARRRTDPCCVEIVGPSIPAEELARLADRMKALGDATRLRLLDLLVQQTRALCVCDITPLFDQLQPTMSHHLRVLREAGLIETEKQGLWAYYWATPEGRAMLEAVTTLP